MFEALSKGEDLCSGQSASQLSSGQSVYQIGVCMQLSGIGPNRRTILSCLLMNSKAA